MNKDLIAKILSKLPDIEMNKVLLKFQSGDQSSSNVINNETINLARSHVVYNFIDNGISLDDIVSNHKSFEESISSNLHVFKSSKMIKDHYLIVSNTNHPDIVAFIVDDLLTSKDTNDANTILNMMFKFKCKEYAKEKDIIKSIDIYRALGVILKRIDVISESVGEDILGDILDIIKDCKSIHSLADLLYVYYSETFDCLSRTTRKKSLRCIDKIINFSIEENVLIPLQLAIYQRYVYIPTYDKIYLHQTMNQIINELSVNPDPGEMIDGVEILKYINEYLSSYNR